MLFFHQILAIFRRDLKAATRDFILLFMLAAPFVVALILRFFIPGVSASVVRLAADGTVDTETVDFLRQYAVVTVYGNESRLTERVAAADDVIGVTGSGETYTLLTEGNEAEGLTDLVARMLDRSRGGGGQGLSVSGSEIGDRRSPLVLYGLAGALLMAVMLGGMMTGLFIIEEKEEFTLSAVNVTPVARGTYLAGKCALGVAVPLLQMLLLPLVMGVAGLSYGKLLVITAATLSGGVVLGVAIGLVSPTQVAGIANMKFLMLAVSASFVVAVAVPERYQVFLYWSPFYWSVRGYMDVIWGAAAWSAVLLKGLWTLLLSGVLLAALSRYIRRGLAAMSG